MQVTIPLNIYAMDGKYIATSNDMRGAAWPFVGKTEVVYEVPDGFNAALEAKRCELEDLRKREASLSIQINALAAELGELAC